MFGVHQPPSLPSWSQIRISPPHPSPQSWTMLGSEAKFGKFPLRSGATVANRHPARPPPEGLRSGLWEAAVGNASRNRSACRWVAYLPGVPGIVGGDVQHGGKWVTNHSWKKNPLTMCLTSWPPDSLRTKLEASPCSSHPPPPANPAGTDGSQMHLSSRSTPRAGEEHCGLEVPTFPSSQYLVKNHDASQSLTGHKTSLSSHG